MPDFGPLADPNFQSPSGNILMATDSTDRSFQKWWFVNERGEHTQIAATMKADGLHLSPISSNWGIEQDEHGYPVVHFD